MRCSFSPPDASPGWFVPHPHSSHPTLGLSRFPTVLLREWVMQTILPTDHFLSFLKFMLSHICEIWGWFKPNTSLLWPVLEWSTMPLTLGDLHCCCTSLLAYIHQHSHLFCSRWPSQQVVGGLYSPAIPRVLSTPISLLANSNAPFVSL